MNDFIIFSITKNLKKKMIVTKSHIVHQRAV